MAGNGLAKGGTGVARPADGPVVSYVFDVAEDAPAPPVRPDDGRGARRSVSLWRQDAACLLLDYLQVYAVLLNLATVRAAWPPSWVDATGWTLAANVDVWGLLRLKHYQHNQVPVPSAAVGSYNAVVWAWVAVCVGLAVARVGLLRSTRFQPRWHALVKRAVFVVAYVLYLPAALVLARTLHCVDLRLPNRHVLDVDNEGGRRHRATPLRSCILPLPLPPHRAYRSHSLCGRMPARRHSCVLVRPTRCRVAPGRRRDRCNAGQLAASCRLPRAARAHRGQSQATRGILAADGDRVW